MQRVIQRLWSLAILTNPFAHFGCGFICCVLPKKQRLSRLAAATYFSLTAQREGRQEKAHPGYAPSGHPALRVRAGRPGFSTAHPVPAKRLVHPCTSPYGPDRPTITAPQGPRKQSGLLSAVVCALRAHAFHAQDARLLFGAPLQRQRLAASFAASRSGVGNDCPKGRRHEVGAFFASTWMCCRKTPQAGANFADRKSAKRGSGVASLLLRFLWPDRENEVAAGRRERPAAAIIR